MRTTQANNSGLIKLALTTLALSAALVVTSLQASELPQPGLYTISVKMENATMGMAQANESTQCITQEEFSNGPDAFTSQQPGQDCSMGKYEMANGRIIMQLQCAIPGGGKAAINGEGTYSTDGFTLTNKMTMEAAGIKMDMTTKAVGTRTGDC